MSSTQISSAECQRFLATLFTDARSDDYVELRCRAVHGMACTYHRVTDIDDIAKTITGHACHTDVYVGVLPRHWPGGTRGDVVEEATVLWADCDTPDSVRALAEFMPQPAITLASGTRDNRHAYWLLEEPTSLDYVERANRSLAQLLGADRQSTDAARILRPPSFNHKHTPPTRVRLIDCDPSRRWRLDEIVDLDPYDATPARGHASRDAHADPLLAIDPVQYVEALVGLRVSRSRKVRCPFHDDRTPSLHVYREARHGWFCFGCRRGGSIYDFAALLWGLDTRGGDFRELRNALSSRLGL